MNFRQIGGALRGSFLALAAGLALTACTPMDPAQVGPGGVFDPHEADNRAVHRFNVAMDKALVRPVGKGVATALPEDVQTIIGNVGDNLSEPSSFVNHMLQGDARGMGVNLYRFVINSTLGLGGIFDAAGAFGVGKERSDFGETLHVWGAPEGAYVELPLLGPSTERDAAGKFVDLFTDPLSYVLPKPEKYVGTAARLTDKVGSRGRFADTVDSVLYDSADSYAQTRLLYLQNRRYELGIVVEDTYIEPDDINTEGF